MKSKLEIHGAGSSVLFIHGAGGSTKSWLYQADNLKASVEVILADLPGHGKAADSKGCISIDEQRDSIFRTLKSSGISSCYMVGHSMGGAIAMYYALAFPDTIKGLVLVGTGARLRVFPEILEGIKKDKEKTLRNIIGFAFSKTAPEALKEKGFQEMMKCSAEVIYNDFLACDKFSVMEKVGSISIPTLIICGSEDTLTPVKYSQYLNQSIKGSRFVVIEEAGHMVMLEKPDEVNKAILGFVNEIESSNRL